MATDVRTPYTEAPLEADAVIFPTHGMQVLDTLVNTLGISILSYCFARRSYHQDLLSTQGWLSLTWARFSILFTFLASWIFVFTSNILVQGVGLTYSVAACRTGIFLCIIFYAISKLFLYSFLAEKVYVVWGAGKTIRSRSPVYKICCLVIFIYTGIFVLMIIGRISEFRSDGVCIIGLKTFSSIPLLSYDLFITAFLTFMFLYPLARHGFVNAKLRSVSARTLVASTVALTTSSINIAILTAMHGRQLGWVCLASCCTDVTINALVLFWVTSRGKSDVASGTTPDTPTKFPTSHGDDSNRHRVAPNGITADPVDRVATIKAQAASNNGMGEWFHKVRNQNNNNVEEAPVEVQVTIMTEMEMEMDMYEGHYGEGSAF